MMRTRLGILLSVAVLLVLGVMTPAAATSDGDPSNKPASLGDELRSRVKAGVGARSEAVDASEQIQAFKDPAAAAFCYESYYSDPVIGADLDVASYGISLDCDDRVWVSGVITADTWDPIELYSVEWYFDTDRSDATGCFGEDYAIVGIWEPSAPEDLIAEAFRLPSCDSAGWVDLGPVFISRTGYSDFVAVVFPEWLIGSPSSFEWWGALESIYSGPDYFPSSGAWIESGYPMGTPAPPPPPVVDVQPGQVEGSGYWMVGDDGAVYSFGNAGFHGSAVAMVMPHYGAGVRAVDIEPSATNNGYWVVDTVGRVMTFGDAPFFGSVNAGSLAPWEFISSISSTATGNGYWVFTTKGRAVPFGDAVFYGDMSSFVLNGPVLDSIPTPSGAGYYMVAADGGIFTFGDAAFYGSMGGVPLNQPVQSLVPDGDGVGYWLVASDGGIFAFDAPFRGSLGGLSLNKPITGMVRFGNGYLMVGEDGGIFNFSDKPFDGSLGANPPAYPITSVAVYE